MVDTSAEGWFHTKQGERVGPVSFVELQRMAREGTLNPRWDMVWTKGMADWVAAGDIEGLYAKEKPATGQAELAPPVEPYVPPKVESVAQRMSREKNWPGVRRRGFILVLLVFPVVWQLAVPWGLAKLVEPLGPAIVGFLQIGAAFVPAVLGIWFSIQRLANVGMSRWWIFGLLVPLLNFWVWYRMAACPPGYAYHRKLDVIGIILAIIHWLVVSALVAWIALSGASLFTAVGRGDLKHQFRNGMEAIRRAAEVK